MTAVVKKRRWGRWGWIALLLVAGVGWGLYRMSQARTASIGLPIGVEVAKVERGTQQQKIVATGVVASQIGTQVKIGSQITGTIRALPADVGTRVKVGQIVAQLDLPDLKSHVDEQQHNVEAAEASLAQAESRLKQAMEAAGYTNEQTAAQIAEAEAALRAAQARVDSSSAAALLQPIQTATGIRKAKATLSSAQSAQKQVEQTVRQQIQQAQANLDEAQVAVDNSQRTLTRQQNLLKKGFIAPEVVDQSEAAYKQAVARRDNAKASLEIAREKTKADIQAAKDQVSQAEASLEAAQADTLQDTLHEADLRSARESQKQAKATLDLQKASHRTDKIKQMAIDEARSAIRQAQANVLQSKSLLNYQFDQLAKTIIRSPISGTVLSITAQQGETVAAGLSAPTLITVADLNRLEVRAYVDETDIGHLRLNLPAEVRVEAFPDRVFKGRVTKVASSSTIKDNVVTYETTIAIDNTDGLLRPDMTTSVSLILGEHPDVLLIPSEAVHQETKRSFVYVMHANKLGADRTEIRAVKTGFDDGASTEILSGLKEGEEVVVAGLSKLGVKAPDAQGGGGGR